jgi:dolichol-phosphate mannosyltransferase
VPTFNEAGNIEPLLNRLESALATNDYQIVVVDDDSPDGTWLIADRAAQRDDRLTVIRRRATRGLSSAILTGMESADGDVFVVMDADLQHDERRILDLVAGVVDGSDLCIGTRSAHGGDFGTFTRRRRLISWAGAAVARAALDVPVSDPMSGFFAISRRRYETVAGDIDPRGFKILLEFLARGPRPTVAEVGYRFGERKSGKTKLNGIVVAQYLKSVGSLALSGRGEGRTG